MIRLILRTRELCLMKISVTFYTSKCSTYSNVQVIVWIKVPFMFAKYPFYWMVTFRNLSCRGGLVNRWITSAILSRCSPPWIPSRWPGRRLLALCFGHRRVVLVMWNEVQQYPWRFSHQIADVLLSQLYSMSAVSHVSVVHRFHEVTWSTRTRA